MAFAIFLLSMSAVVPAKVSAKESSADNLLRIQKDMKAAELETGGIVSSPDEYKVTCRIPVEAAFTSSSTRLPSNVTFTVTATLKAIEQAPMPATAENVDGVMTSRVVLTNAGKSAFDPIEYTVPGDYLYELEYSLQSNTARLSINGRRKFFVRVAVRNGEDGGLTGTILVYQDLDGANQNKEEGKLGDTKVNLSYRTPTTPTTNRDPDPVTPNTPDTPNRPNPNLPDTNTPGTTTTNQSNGTKTVTTTSTDSSKSSVAKPNTATETSLLTYLFWAAVSGGLVIFFLLLARRKAEES